MTTQSLTIHRCVHCSREFNRSEHLVRHERTHTKEKPYKCTLCPHAFARRDLLRRHELKAHRRGQPPRKAVRSSQNLAPKTTADGQVLMNAEVEQNWNALQHVDASTVDDIGMGEDLLNARLTGDALPEAIAIPGVPVGEVNQSMQDYILQDAGFWFDSLDTTAFTAFDTSEVLADRSSPQKTPFSVANFGARAAGKHILSQPSSPSLHDTNSNLLAGQSFSSNSKDRLNITETCWMRIQLEVSYADPQYVLPPKDELSRFIFRYFGSFHRHQPFLHEPTWSATHSPVALVLAVCANGALYSLERPAAVELYKIAVQMTRLTDEGIHALQTMMLLTAFAAWSGTKEDLRTALEFHGRLAFAIRQEWALSENDEGAEVLTWEAWLARESLKRVTFCIFTLMNLMTIAYDIPSPLLLEAQHGMPAHERQWCASTEAEWTEAMRCAGSQTWPSAQAIVERLVDESLPVPSHIGMFGCHVLISFLLQKIILLRRSCPTKDVGYIENRRYFVRALRRWQLMWESEPEASLSPDHPQGPILFNCTALLRVSYVRLVSDYSPIRRNFAASYSAEKIASFIAGIEAPVRGPETTRAAIQACLALRVPTQLGFKMIARTSFWVWSVQHALSYFECALLLSKWLQATQEASDLSDEERGIRCMLEQIVGPSNGHQLGDSSVPLDVAMLKKWAELFKTENTTVWQIMPKMAQVLEVYADLLLDTEK